MRRRVVLLFLLSVLGGCVLRPMAKPLDAVRESLNVQSARPKVLDLWEKVVFTGFVEPRLIMNVHFLVAGRVAACTVREGEKVQVGDDICRLDLSLINLEVARTANSVRAAKKVLETNLPEKQKALFDAGVIGQAEFEQVRIQSESAKAQHADASSLHEMALKKQREHVLTAPWDATVMKVFAKPGQPVVPEVPIAVLSDERTVQVSVDVHAGYFPKVKVGASAILTNLSSQRLEKPFDLEVVEKATAVSPDSQSFRVSLRPLRPLGSQDLTPGMLVGGEIHLLRKADALSIPQTSLISWEQTGEAEVFVVREQVVERRSIRTGVLDSGRIEVKSGLSLDESVVVEPPSGLAAGMRVTVLPAFDR